MAQETFGIPAVLNGMNKILIAFLLLATPASAQSLGEKTGVNQLIDKPPTATDVLLEIHQFDLFQQQVSDSADKRGDDGVKAIAVAEANAAEKRGDALTEMQEKAGLTFKFPEEPSKTRDNRLGGLGGSVAEVYVREFYKAQHAEYDSVLSTLKRYLEKPDNDAVKAFVDKQIPLFEAGLKKIEAAETLGPSKPQPGTPKTKAK